MNCTCLPTEPDSIGDIFGYLAGSIIAISYIAQGTWMLKLESFKDMSHIFLALQLLVAILFVVYGILDTLQPLIITESIIGCLIIVTIILKIIYDRKPGKVEEVELDKEEPDNEKHEIV